MALHWTDVAATILLLGGWYVFWVFVIEFVWVFYGRAIIEMALEMGEFS